MRIGFRTIKTAIGTAISVFLAQILGPQYVVSAGILTILCIQTTRKKTLETAFARFCACLVALVVSFLFFTLLGKNVFVVALIMLLLIPITVRFHISGGIGTSAIVMLQMYHASFIHFSMLIDLLVLVTVSIGVALVVNFYMPHVDKELDNYQKQTEEMFRQLFHKMAKGIRGEEMQGEEMEIKKAEEIIRFGKKLGLREYQNNLFAPDDKFHQYFSVKEKQLDVIRRVVPIINSISSTHKQNDIIADFLDNFAEAMRPEATESIPLLQLHEMRQLFRELPLPETMEEFENRAYLLQFVYEMEQFIMIKRGYGRYHKSITIR